MTSGAPTYVASVLFCEKVLREQDEVLSLIRIIDRVTVARPAADGDEVRPAIRMTAVLLVKGAAVGNYTVTLGMINPQGSLQQRNASVTTVVNPGQNGFNLILDIGIEIGTEGIYWLDVAIEGHPVTRAPLQVIFSDDIALD